MLSLEWGGTAIERLDEIKAWLANQAISIVVISETRWTFENTWSDANWHYVHTGDPQTRGSGVLIMVSAQLCTAADLRWEVCVPGRLLHLRILMPVRNVDVIGCYHSVT